MISVIVPIYNVAEYLPKCIQSICDQTYRNLEIILVDDGSTDESPQICDKYAAMDERIVVHHKKNGGLVSARKAGLRMARGEYIGYVDGDDWIEPDMYECLFRCMNEEKAEVVMCGRYEDTGEVSKEVFHGIPGGRYGKEEMIRQVYPRMITNQAFFEWGLFPGVWDKLFRRECLEPFAMAVDERITMGEDAACVYPCLLHADSIYVLHRCLYHYRQSAASMVKQAQDPQRERERFKVLYASVNSALEKQADVYDLRAQWREYVLFLMVPRAGVLYEGIEKLDYLFPFPGVKKGSKVIVYAMGTYGQHLYRFLERTGFCKVAAVTDRLWKELREQGFPAISPQDIPRYEYDAVVVASSFAGVRQAIYKALSEKCPLEKIHLMDVELIMESRVMRAFGLDESI